MNQRLLKSTSTIVQLGALVARPLTLAACRALVQRRIETREELFLTAAARLVYAHPGSPYLPLLRHAGCEEGDLRTMVRRRGLEAALKQLRDDGVYLTFEEFKGRRPIVRGNRTFQFTESEFDNPRPSSGFDIRTGATRSAGTPVHVSLDHIAAQAPDWRLMVEGLGGSTGPVIIWFFSRRAVGLKWWISMAHTGLPPYRWFYMDDPKRDPISFGHRLLFRTGQAAALLRGSRLSYPVSAPLAEAGRVLNDVLGSRSRRGACTVVTTPSAAVRLAALAGERGEDLERVTFLLGAEPLTPGKAAEIQRCGGRVGSFYAFSEAGSVTAPCGTPQRADEGHLLTDDFAMILHRRPSPGGGGLDAFMFTSLLPSAPKIMLNVESDDFGEVWTRRCGCLFDELGLDRHLAEIRSFTKLTGEGMTVLGTDVLSILEEVLPREFGGGSIDYQLLEVEDEAHLTRLQLIVSPGLGPLDEEGLRRRFLEELHRRPGHSFIWRQAETVQVVRRTPVLTPGGKLLPFYTQASSRAPEAEPSPPRASGSSPGV